jgi:hypothetical protein
VAGAAGRRATDFSKCRTGLRSLAHWLTQCMCSCSAKLNRIVKALRGRRSVPNGLAEASLLKWVAAAAGSHLLSRPDVGIFYYAFFSLPPPQREKEWAPCRSGVVNRTIHDFIIRKTDRARPSEFVSLARDCFQIIGIRASAKDKICRKLEGTRIGFNLFSCPVLRVHNQSSFSFLRVISKVATGSFRFGNCSGIDF